MQATLLAQGIDAIGGAPIQIIAVNIKRNNTVNPLAPFVAFAINNWATSGTTYPKRIISDDAGVDGSTPATPNPSSNEAADALGGSGQGTSPNPPSRFGNHFIVKANGMYYDPSYGLGGYVDRKDYEDAAFAGRIYIDRSGVWWLDALPASDHDPLTTTDLICTYSG
jgi:hypothetical protein